MGKSPWAEAETHEYRYPDPLQKDAVDRFGQTVVDEGEISEGHWLKLRVPRSRGDQDIIADATQSVVAFGEGDATSKQQIAQANRRVFELLVEGWSFTDRTPTGDDYARLDDWSGNWVTACLADAMARGTVRDWGKEIANSSPKPRSSRKTSVSGATPD